MSNLSDGVSVLYIQSQNINDKLYPNMISNAIDNIQIITVIISYHCKKQIIQKTCNWVHQHNY